MDRKKEARSKIRALKDGEDCCFNMSEEGGATCYRCNGMFLLFEIPLYGGKEQYMNIYNEKHIEDLIRTAFDWT